MAAMDRGRQGLPVICCCPIGAGVVPGQTAMRTTPLSFCCAVTVPHAASATSSAWAASRRTARLQRTRTEPAEVPAHTAASRPLRPST